jgi:Na+/H+-dicarboxylate symporter
MQTIPTGDTMKKIALWQQVIIGLILGAIVGYILGPDAAQLKVLGTIFINLIKMVMVPLVFFALVSGITSIGQGGDFKRFGLKSLFAYLLTSAFAVCIGLGAGLFFKPGEGLNLEHALTGTATLTTPKAPPSMMDTLMTVIPTNAIEAMAQGHILQVIVFAIFVGIALNSLGSKTAKVTEACQQAAQLMFKIIEGIVKLAPYGVFGFIAATVGTQGMDVLVSLAKLVEAVLAACLIQYVLFGVFIIVFARISPMPFYRKILATQTLAFSTSSSKATLSTAMREMQEKLGVSNKSTNFVLPLGAAINMDGTAIYLGICALFFAQAMGVTLSGHDYIMIILTSTLASIGAAGIPSGSLIFMGMVLSSVGLPIEGIALIAGVDRILDMFRTTINITGDCAITLIVDASEKELDLKTYNA